MDRYLKYKEYANKVISGEILACKWIILACKRYLSWFENDEYEFREDKIEEILSFFSILRLFEGKWAGQEFKLTEPQKWIIYNIFGFYHKGTDKRVVKKVLLLVPRKFSKSTFSAAIALYLLIFEDPGTQVINMANNAKQAHTLFRMETELIKPLNKKKRFKLLRDTIEFPRNKSFCTVLASDADNADSYGANFILDEAHAYKDSKLWDVMISGQGHLRNPLGIIISTFGFLGPGYFLYDYMSMCKDLLLGNKNDDTQFAAIYTLDDNDDWKDESVWIKAQPHLDITVSREFMREQVLSAINNPALESSVRTKNFNQFISLKDVWIKDDIIRDSMKDFSKIPELNNEYYDAYYAVDLSSVSDLSAVARCIELDGKYYISFKSYIPYDSIEDSVNSELYKLWIKQGYLTVTDGNVLDVDYIINDLSSESQKNNFCMCGYDPWQSLTFAVKATDLGLPIEEFRQSIGAFSPFTNAFESGIRNGSIILEYSPLVIWAFTNTTIKEDTNGNRKPVKGSNKDLKIDPVIASIMAYGTCIKHSGNYNDILFLNN